MQLGKRYINTLKYILIIPPPGLILKIHVALNLQNMVRQHHHALTHTRQPTTASEMQLPMQRRHVQ